MQLLVSEGQKDILELFVCFDKSFFKSKCNFVNTKFIWFVANYIMIDGTEITEVTSSAFVYRLFHEDFSAMLM